MERDIERVIHWDLEPSKGKLVLALTHSLAAVLGPDLLDLDPLLRALQQLDLHHPELDMKSELLLLAMLLIQFLVPKRLLVLEKLLHLGLRLLAL